MQNVSFSFLDPSAILLLLNCNFVPSFYVSFSFIFLHKIMCISRFNFNYVVIVCMTLYFTFKLESYRYRQIKMLVLPPFYRLSYELSEQKSNFLI